MNISNSIRILNGEEALLFVEHQERNDSTSGVGDTPLFSAFSRQHITIDKSARIDICKQRWAKPIDKVGWEKVWGAFDHGINPPKIIGSIALSTTRLIPTQAHRAVLGIGIEPGFRHHGLGKALMRTALSWAKQHSHLEWIDLCVFVDNAPARRLYERIGFIETGRTIDCFRVDGHSLDDIQMSLNLRQFEDPGERS